MPGPPSNDNAAARLFDARQPLGGVRGRNHVALFIFREREQPVHLIDLLLGHAHRRRDVRLRLPAEVDVAHVGPHRGQPPQHTFHHLRVTGGEQPCEILQRNAQRLDTATPSATGNGWVFPVNKPLAQSRAIPRRWR